MDHARHTIFGAAALSRGLACLLLTLCLIPGAATTAQAFEAGRHAAPPQGAESEYEQQMRTQRILQMLDDIERLAKEHAREERRAKAARDGGGPAGTSSNKAGQDLRDTTDAGAAGGAPSHCVRAGLVVWSLRGLARRAREGRPSGSAGNACSEHAARGDRWTP